MTRSPVSDLVVVGGSLAGLRAVEAARSAGYRGRITLVGREPHPPYDRPPLSKAFLTDADSSATVLKTVEELAELDVRLLLGASATSLDTAAGRLAVGDRAVPFDALVIATGAAPYELDGQDRLAGVTALRTLDDAEMVRAAIRDGARVVVVGAGFIGSEVASSARHHGNAVTIVEAAEVPLVRAVGPEMGRALVDLHRRHGTDIRTGVGVRELVGDHRVEAVVLDDGTRLDADLVVVGIGVRPATDWLKGSGVRLHPRDGGVVCDASLRTSVPGVWAAGDVVHAPNGVFGGVEMRLENWSSAAEQGTMAGWNAVSPDAPREFATVPYFWSDWYDSRIQFVGTPECDEVVVVLDDRELDREEKRFVALYRRADRLVGALTINQPSKIMKYRRHIGVGGSWEAAHAMFESPGGPARRSAAPLVGGRS